MTALRWIVLALAGLVLVASVWISAGLRGSDDVTQLLPTSDPVVADALLVLREFRQAETLFLDVGMDGVGALGPTEGATVQRAADRVHEQLTASGMLARVRYRVDQGIDPDLPARLQRSLPGLLGPEDQAALEALLTPEALARHMEDLRVRLAQPEGIITKRMVQGDPLELTNLWAKKMTALAQPAGGVEIRDGRIWSGDGRRILIMAYPSFAPADTVQDGKLLARLEELRGELRGMHAGLGLRAVGSHVATFDNATTMKRDIQWASWCNTVVIGVLGAMTFRRRHYVLLMFLPTVWGIALASAAYALWAQEVAMVVVGSGVALVGLAVDYGIQVLYRSEQETTRGGNPWSRVRHMVAPLTLAAGTSCAALACLLLSPLPGQRQMGVLGGIGIAGAAFFSVAVLPLLIRGKPVRRPWGTVDFPGLVRRFMAWRDRHRGVLVPVLLVCVALSIVGIARLGLASDLRDLNHLEPAHQKDQEGFTATWEGLDNTSVVTAGATLEEAQQAAERVQEVLAGHERAGRVGRLASPTMVLPSRRTQQAHHDRWRAYWTEDRQREVRQRLEAAATAAGFAPRVFAPFVESWTAAPEFLEPAALRDSPFESLLSTFTAGDARQQYVLTIFQAARRADLPGILRDVRAAVPGVQVLDPPGFADHVGGLIRTGLWRMALLGFVVMIPILRLLLGRGELVLITLLPTVLSMLMTLGLMGWMGVPINLMSSIFILVLFGMGIDYSIYLVGERLAEHRGQAGASGAPLGAIVLCSLTTLAGFFFLATAQHSALRTVGVACFLGILTSLVLAVMLVPPLLDYVLPRDRRLRPVTFGSMAGLAVGFLHVLAGWVFYFGVMRGVYAVRHRGDVAARQRAVRGYLRRLLTWAFAGVPVRGFRMQMRGFAEHEKAYVWVANHQSAVDVLVAMALPVDVRMVVKPWVWKSRVLGPLVRDAGYIQAVPGEAEGVLGAVERSIGEGVGVLLFPEGTRSQDGSLGRFHSGAFRAAGRCGAMVRPLAIANLTTGVERTPRSVNAALFLVEALAPSAAPGGDDPLRWVHWAAEVRRVTQERLAELVCEARAGTDPVAAMAPLYRYQGGFAEHYVRAKLRYDPLPREVDRLVPAAGVIVDAGCGYGAVTHWLAHRGPGREVWGVDFDRRKIAAARARAGVHPNVRFLVRDLARWRFMRAEAILLIDVLHYWSKPRQEAILKRVVGALRPGGVLVFRETTDERAVAGAGFDHWSERVLTALGHNRAGDGITFLRRAEYEELFRREGLVVVEEAQGAALGGHWAVVLRKESDSGHGL